MLTRLSLRARTCLIRPGFALGLPPRPLAQSINIPVLNRHMSVHSTSSMSHIPYTSRRFQIFKWTMNLTLFSFVLFTFGYSWWWHQKREEARLLGLDLQQWSDEFTNSGQDPVANWMMERGWLSKPSDFPMKQQQPAHQHSDSVMDSADDTRIPQQQQ